MTQAFNLSQFANKVNTSGQADLTTAVTGTLPVANGGTNQTTYTNGQLLIGNTTGNTLTKATLTAGTGISVTNGAGAITIAYSGGSGGFSNMQVFTSPGTFTTPASTTQIKVTVVGGGGNGINSNNGSGGGGGGAAIYVGPVSASTPYAVTVGSAGGTSSFAALASATGGSAGVNAPVGSKVGGAGGAGTAGTLQIKGGAGAPGIQQGSPVITVAGSGGSSLLGGGGLALGSPFPLSNGGAYGGGGGSASGGTPAGAAGVVIVEY